MTTFRQGGNPWFQFSEPPRWLARAVAADAIDTAMRWTSADASPASRSMPSNREDGGEDFVRLAIQRSYQ